MNQARRPAQSGSTLITCLILLVLITLLSVSAFRSASMQELAVANSHEFALSFAAADSAVNDAIDQITSRYSSNLGQPLSDNDCVGATPSCTFYYRPTCTRDAATADPPNLTCDVVTTPTGINYLWDTTQATTPAYYRDLDESWWEANGIAFGSNGGATATIPKVKEQPRYVVELVRTVKPLSAGQPTQYYYQITGRGLGRGIATTVLIQTVYLYPEIKG